MATPTEPAAWLEDASHRASDLHMEGLVCYEALTSFLMTLSDPVWSGTPSPFISGTDADGITAEFEAGPVDLSLDAASDGDITIFVSDPVVSWEGPIDTVPDGLRVWMERLRMAR